MYKKLLVSLLMVGSLLVVAQDEKGQNPFEAAAAQIEAVLHELYVCKKEWLIERNQLILRIYEVHRKFSMYINTENSLGDRRVSALRLLIERNEMLSRIVEGKENFKTCVDTEDSLSKARLNLIECRENLYPVVLSKPEDKAKCQDAIRVFELYGIGTGNDEVVSIAEKMRAIVDPLS